MVKLSRERDPTDCYLDVRWPVNVRDGLVRFTPPRFLGCDAFELRHYKCLYWHLHSSLVFLMGV